MSDTQRRLETELGQYPPADADVVTCPGRCCEAFFLSEQAIEAITTRPNKVQDGEFIADMLIPLTLEQAEEVMWKQGDNPAERPGLKGAYFTCKHWDRETRLCSVYETRPRMCRTYPERGPCEHGCSYRYQPESVVAPQTQRA